jgi:ATP-binding cassette, subfamily C, bacterial LapB
MAEQQAAPAKVDDKPPPQAEVCYASLLDCLLLVCSLEGRPTSITAITAGLPLDDGNLTPDLFVRAANRAGLAAMPMERPIYGIPENVLPAIVALDEARYSVVTDIDIVNGYAMLMVPDTHALHQITLAELEKIYTGHVFYLRPTQQFDSRTPKIYKSTGEHWFWGVLKSSSSIYRDVLVASLLINLFVLAQPLFVMNVYDRVVPNNAVETLWALALGIAFVYMFDLGLKALRSYMVELAGKRTDVIVSARLFERVLNLKMGSRPISVGAFANRLHEFDSIRNFITSTTILALIDLPFLFIFLAFIYYLGGWLVLVPLIVIPLSVFLAYQAQVRLRPAIENVMRGASKKNATLVESMVGVETIKTTGAESKVQRDWEQSVGYVSQWSLQARLLSNSALQSVQFLQQLAMVAIVVWGVYLISELELTLGGLIACVILNGRALAPLGQVASLLTNYDHAEGTLKSLDEIMSLPVERAEEQRFLHRAKINGEITLKDVTFSYRDQPTPALQNLSIAIKPGEKVGIIGRIGSGKSTLSKLLLALHEPDRGSVLVDGFDIKQLDPADLRHEIGYVSQDIMLFFGTIRDNITLGQVSVEDDEVVNAAQQVGIDSFINSHPLGYGMPVGERGETLSGGQRQAIGLARVFLRKPSVLLLDEPTASMDQGNENLVKQSLRDFARNKTMILITHKMSMLDIVDRLIVLDNGRLVADGPKEQVIESLRQGNVRGTKK